MADISAFSSTQLTGLTFLSTVDVSGSTGPSLFALKMNGGANLYTATIWLDKYIELGGHFVNHFTMGYGLSQARWSDTTPDTVDETQYFGQNSMPGVYHITHVELKDLAGRYVAYTGSQLTSMGIKTAMQVVNTQAASAQYVAMTPTVQPDGKVVLSVAPNIAGREGAMVGFGMEFETDGVAFDKQLSAPLGSQSSYMGATSMKGEYGVDGTAPAGGLRDVQISFKPTADVGTLYYHVTKLQVGDVRYSSMPNEGYGYVTVGSAGNDTIEGGKANRVIDAGGAFDTVTYWGNRAQFDVTATEKGVQVSGAYVSETLLHTERIVFSDSTVAFDTDGAAGKAYRIYQAAFNRTPDAKGLGYWVNALDKGAALKDVAAGFVAGAEFKQLFGQDPTAATFVTGMYRNVLQRAPDQAGLDYWVGVMNGGLSQAEVLAYFSESPENVALVGNSIHNGILYTPWV